MHFGTATGLQWPASGVFAAEEPARKSGAFWASDSEKPLLLEHGYLPLILHRPAPRSARSPDYGEYGERLQRSAGHEDALRVRTLVRRINQKAFGRRLRKVGGHQAFQDFIVLKPQPNPQAFGPRTRRKSLAGQRFRIAELPHEVHALDLPQIHRHHIPRGVQQLEFALMNELLGRHVTRDRIPVHLPDDNFLVGRGHGVSGFDGRAAVFGQKTTAKPV